MTQPPCTPPTEAAPVDVGHRIIAADADRGCWRTYDGTGTSEIPSLLDIQPRPLSSIEAAPLDVGVLVVESAHMVPRADPPQSKAQKYTQAQLDAWDPPFAHVRLATELHASRRRDRFGVEKDEDARALYLWASELVERGGLALLLDCTQRFPKHAPPAWRSAIIADMNQRQNTMRYFDYDDDESMSVRALFGTPRNFISGPVWNPLKGLKHHRASKAAFNWSYVMAVYVAMHDSDGDVRVDGQGRPISTRTVRTLLGMHSNRPRGIAAGKIQHDLYGGGYNGLKGTARHEHDNREWRLRCEAALLALINFFRVTHPHPTPPTEAAPHDVGHAENLGTLGTQSQPMSPTEVSPLDVGTQGA